MVKVLIECEVNEKAIDILTNLNERDISRVEVNERELTIQGSSDIRHGCASSTTLFKLKNYTNTILIR